MTHEPSLEQILRALDAGLLEWQSTGDLGPALRVPAWLGPLLPAEGERWSLEVVEQSSPFLAHFLIDAETREDLPAESGIWVEGSPDRDEIALQALVFGAAERRWVLIRRLGVAYDEQQRVLQRARERALDHERLVVLQQALQREQQRLKQVSQELEATIHALPQLLVLLDRECRVLRVNRTAELWGLQVPERRTGAHLHDLLHPRCYEEQCYLKYFCREAWRRLERVQPSYLDAEDTILRRSLRYQFSPIAEESEAISDSYAVVLIQDVTELRRAEAMRSEVIRLRTELQKESVFDNIIGNSCEMRQIYTLMQQAASSTITVLIQGESGTGKELVARAIHFNGDRRRGPFVTVNCAAIPENLIESELFGHERGAFTGAVMRRTGKFEQAQGGTIFLDEIGEMKPSLQAKLLRVLQEREIQRVGGMVDIPVDVRVIAATNQELERSMKMGEFREDLYYRIAVFPIRIPPLRQRRDDIAPLVEHFFESCLKEMRHNLRGITTEAMRLLVSYHWPGNVRELENIIQRAILLETSHSIQANNPAIQEIAATEPDVADGMLPVMPLDELERRAIVTALETTERNVTQAATLLGINRATIYRKLKRYGIEP